MANCGLRGINEGLQLHNCPAKPGSSGARLTYNDDDYGWLTVGILSGNNGIIDELPDLFKPKTPGAPPPFSRQYHGTASFLRTEIPSAYLGRDGTFYEAITPETVLAESNAPDPPSPTNGATSGNEAGMRD